MKLLQNAWLLGGSWAGAEPMAARQVLRFDPTSGATSLELDVRRPKASLRGRAVTSEATPSRHYVVAAPAETSGSRPSSPPMASAVGAAGAFAFDALPPGTWELLLVRTSPGGASTVVGRRMVELAESRDDFVLVEGER